ncbi:hypothetical protein D3C84_1076610 [compost metagenome]
MNAGGRQRGFAADHGNKFIAQRVQLIGNGIEELRAALGAQAAISGVRGSGSLGGGIDFFRRGLIEIVR